MNIESLIERVKKIKGLFWFLGVHVIAFILFFIILDILSGGFILYKYVILAQQKEPEVINKTFKFEDKAYQDILLKLQTRGEKFESSSGANYQNPFQIKTPVSE